MTTYRVASSPYEEDGDLPWDYQEDAFVSWVDEVFMEGYKKDENASFPSPQECVDLLTAAGYHVEVLA